jgi:hemolysin activation/secretion protein
VQDFFDVSGDSRSVNLSVRHLLPRQGALEPYLEASLERSVHDDVVGFSGVNLGSKVGTSPVSLALGATWQGTDISAFAQARLRHNTAWGGWSGRADYASARAGAAPHWSALDVAGEVRKAMGAGAEWVVRTQAQWSADALIAPQQFRVGGASLMRGLKEGELAGDKGIALALEYWWSLPAQHRVGVLFDSATVRRNQPVAGDVGHASAASAGLAWQWQPMPAVQLQVSAARLVRVHHLPQRSVGDSRVHASLNWTF